MADVDPPKTSLPITKEGFMTQRFRDWTQAINRAVNINTVNVQSFTAGGTIGDAADLILSTGTHTLIMPLIRTEVIEIKSISGTITLDPGTNTVENGNTISTTVSRRFYLNGTVWLEL
jgi:hypothetical protein